VLLTHVALNSPVPLPAIETPGAGALAELKNPQKRGAVFTDFYFWAYYKFMNQPAFAAA
jgi:hypothetical protein